MKNTDMDPTPPFSPPPGMPSFQDYGNRFYSPNSCPADNGASSSSAPPPTMVPHGEQLEYYGFDKFDFPPGFRFVPEDWELVTYYLPRKIGKKKIPTDKVQDTNVYKHNPDILTEMFKQYREDNIWYFYTSREKKYKNGKRPNRETEDKVGFWKATGKDKEIKDNAGRLIARKKSLAYIKGKAIDKNASTNVKTEWLMHEYVLEDKPTRGKDANTMELDAVLCKIYKKDSNGESKVKAKKDEIITVEKQHGVTDSMQQNEEQSEGYSMLQQQQQQQQQEEENRIIQQGQDVVLYSSLQQQQEENNMIQKGQDVVIYSSVQQQQEGHNMIQKGQDVVLCSSTQQQQEENNMIQQGQDLVDNYSLMQQQDDCIVEQDQNQQNDMFSLQYQLLHQLQMQQPQLRRPIFQQNQNQLNNQFYMQQPQQHSHILHPENDYISWQQLEDDTDRYLYNAMQQQQQQAPGIIDQNVAGPSNACFSNAASINSFSSTDLGQVNGCYGYPPQCFTTTGGGPTPFNNYDHFNSYSTSSSMFFGAAAPPGASHTVQHDQVGMGSRNKVSGAAPPEGSKRKRGKSINIHQKLL